MSPSKLLITGASGLLGSNLVWFFKDRYAVLGLYHNHPVSFAGARTEKRNLLDGEALRDCVRSFQPDVLVHCAALADVDACEKNKAEAERANIETTKNVVESLTGLSIPLIHISTDCVFDGVKGNYSETDSVHPINHYGLTKWRAEAGVLERENALVLRTTIFGWNIQDKESLGEWILHRLMRKEKISGFKDVIFSPIYTMELGRLMERAWQKGLTGLYHCAGSDACSKYDFAVRLARLFRLDAEGVRPILVDGLDLPARRPKNLSLNTAKLAELFGIQLPRVQESLQSFFDDFERGIPRSLKRPS